MKVAFIERFPIRTSGMTLFEFGMTGGCFECRIMPGMKVAFIERFPIRSSGMTNIKNNLPAFSFPLMRPGRGRLPCPGVRWFWLAAFPE